MTDPVSWLQIEKGWNVVTVASRAHGLAASRSITQRIWSRPAWA